MFELADTNKDQQISVDEFRLFVKNQNQIAKDAASALADTEKVLFDKIDLDKNGGLSKEEFKKDYQKQFGTTDDAKMEA